MCQGGCAGIWFDAHELKKLDEAHEGDPLFLENLCKTKTVDPDLGAPIQCPKCENMKLMRHFYSSARKIEVDECAKCGGFWLDSGELTTIHKMYPKEEDRKTAFRAAFKEFAPALDNMRTESKEKLERARSVDNIFRFISPSNYWWRRLE